jgi:hypothetical protein
MLAHKAKNDPSSIYDGPVFPPLVSPFSSKLHLPFPWYLVSRFRENDHLHT